MRTPHQQPFWLGAAQQVAPHAAAFEHLGQARRKIRRRTRLSGRVIHEPCLRSRPGQEPDAFARNRCEG